EKPHFVGKEALLAQKASGRHRSMIAFKMVDSAIPRAGMDVYQGDERVGHVTSGSVLPTVGGSWGLALVAQALAEDSQIWVDIRGKRELAQVARRPLYSAHVKD